MRHGDALCPVRPHPLHRGGAIYKLSADAASLTHGHPAARQSAGIFSLVIHALTSGAACARQRTTPSDTCDAGHLRKGEDPDPDVVARLEAALRLAAAGVDVLAPRTWSASSARGGWRREALASRSMRCWPRFRTRRRLPGAEAHFRAAIAVAVNHSGDSDSTASIAGNILGTFYGAECLPAQWLEALEAPEVIRGMASQLAAVTGA